jgi:ribosomal protein S18 acetylase RimI-like enzyme
MDDSSIMVLDRADEACLEAFARLIPLLYDATPPPDQDTVARVLAHPANTVFAARADGRITGLLTLVLIELGTGREARIEDVVVDPSARRLGTGRALVDAALSAAAAAGARHVDLTSAPYRESARRLYQAMGFVPRDTTVFRRVLRPGPE